jgi:hypothetical protein
MTFYSDGLVESQLEVLRKTGRWLSPRRFYLAGGTALAIYLRHRRSVDLDWFTMERLSDPIGFAQALRDEGILFITDQTAPGTLHGQVSGVRVSFLEFRYPLLSPLAHWEEIDIHLASLDDLACMKLSAVAQRGSKKDFFDIYALCMQHRPLAELLKLYRSKFSVTDIGPVIYRLAYFDDAESERDPALLEKVSWEKVKQAIVKWVREIAA